MSSHVSVKGTGAKSLLKALQNVSITVGIHEAEGAEQGGGEGVTVAEEATNAEIGIGQPPRAPLTGWFDENEQALRQDLEKIARAAVRQGRPIEQAAQRFGAMCVGQIQQRIADGIPPELSDRRKKEKQELSGVAKDTPLIFTGALRSAFRSKVEVLKNWG